MDRKRLDHRTKLGQKKKESKESSTGSTNSAKAPLTQAERRKKKSARENHENDSNDEENAANISSTAEAIMRNRGSNLGSNNSIKTVTSVSNQKQSQSKDSKESSKSGKSESAVSEEKTGPLEEDFLYTDSETDGSDQNQQGSFLSSLWKKMTPATPDSQDQEKSQNLKSQLMIHGIAIPGSNEYDHRRQVISDNYHNINDQVQQNQNLKFVTSPYANQLCPLLKLQGVQDLIEDSPQEIDGSTSTVCYNDIVKHSPYYLPYKSFWWSEENEIPQQDKLLTSKIWFRIKTLGIWRLILNGDSFIMGYVFRALDVLGWVLQRLLLPTFGLAPPLRWFGPLERGVERGVPSTKLTLNFNDSRRTLYHSHAIGYVNTASKIDDQFDERVKCLRLGADLHRGVRESLYKDGWLTGCPGNNTNDNSNLIQSQQATTEQLIQRAESAFYSMIKQNKLNADVKSGGPGQYHIRHAFPTGVNINEIAAHDSRTPNLGVTQYIRKRDVIKLDYGISVNDYILDSAFTFTWSSGGDTFCNPKSGESDYSIHQPLIDGVKEAVYGAISECGADAWVDDVSAVVQEIMESYEVEIPGNCGKFFGYNKSGDSNKLIREGLPLPGQTYQVKAIKNLSGHLIQKGIIHAGKQLPSIDYGSNYRMLEGEQWAIECFGVYNGLGIVQNLNNFPQSSPCTHFMKPSTGVLGGKIGGNGPNTWVSSENIVKQRCSNEALNLYKFIGCEFGTLAFCPRWIMKPPQSIINTTVFNASSMSSISQNISNGRSIALSSQTSTTTKLNNAYLDIIVPPSYQYHFGYGSKAYYKDSQYGRLSSDSPKKIQKLLDELVNCGSIHEYPPLADSYGSFVAQFEHTILLREEGKEVLTRGMDY